jgi:hypothetical protein
VLVPGGTYRISTTLNTKKYITYMRGEVAEPSNAALAFYAP